MSSSVKQSLLRKDQEYDQLKLKFEQLNQNNLDLQEVMGIREKELDSEHNLRTNYAQENERLTNNVRHLERVMSELEDKNKRMTDLINTSICNKA